MQLDAIDKKLINLLQQNSKQTTRQLSLQLNLSTTAVYERIRKLENDKVITDFVALIDKKKVNKSFLALCHIKLIQHTKEAIAVFEKEILKLEEVSEVYHVSGDYDYIIKIYLKNIEEFREFMVLKLTAIPFIGSTQSSFAIKEVKSTTKITL